MTHRTPHPEDDQQQEECPAARGLPGAEDSTCCRSKQNDRPKHKHNDCREPLHAACTALIVYRP